MAEEKVPRLAGDGSESPQAQEGQTVSQPPEETIYKFDPKAKYQDPDDPSRVIDGNLLKTRINLGTLASKFQSDRDNAKALAQELQQALAQRDKQLAELQRQMAAKQQEETTVAMLERLGIKPGQQDTGDSGSSFFGDDEPAQPQLTQKQVIQEIKGLENRLAQKSEDDVKAIIDRYNRETLLSQQSSQRIADFVNRARQANESQLRTALPDVPEQDIAQVVNLTEAARALDMVAVEAARNNDLDKANEAYAQSYGRITEAIKLQTDLYAKQQSIAADKERQQETEMFAPGSKLWQDLEKREVSYNKEKSKKAAEDHIKKAKEVEKNFQRARSQ